MQQPTYPIETSEDALTFRFISVGPTKAVNKIVQYTPLPSNPGVFNLAFGDDDGNGDLNDLVVSDNEDMETVLATVIQTLFVFFETHPDKIVFFTGSTAARTRLYRIAISRLLNDVQEAFLVEGILGQRREQFRPNVTYEAFLIQRI